MRLEDSKPIEIFIETALVVLSDGTSQYLRKLLYRRREEKQNI